MSSPMAPTTTIKTKLWKTKKRRCAKRWSKLVKSHPIYMLSSLTNWMFMHKEFETCLFMCEYKRLCRLYNDSIENNVNEVFAITAVDYRINFSCWRSFMQSIQICRDHPPLKSYWRYLSPLNHSELCSQKSCSTAVYELHDNVKKKIRDFAKFLKQPKWHSSHFSSWNTRNIVKYLTHSHDFFIE